MKKNTLKGMSFSSLRAKLMSTVAMLLVASTLLVTSSYAWFVMSTAPEVTGIDTQVGANGALEIALLNQESWDDLSKLDMGDIDESAAGDTAAAALAANRTWGNLVNLADPSYGLSKITLSPARLYIQKQTPGTTPEEGGGEGQPPAQAATYEINSNLLKTPIYGEDGRVKGLDFTKTLARTYGKSGFTEEGHGVRAIGTAANMSTFQLGMNTARSQISNYTAAARSAAKSTLTKNGNAIANTVMKKVLASKAGGDVKFGTADVAPLLDLARGLDSALNQVELALRCAFGGFVATAASGISEGNYPTEITYINDATHSLSDLLGRYGKITDVISEMSDYVTTLTRDRADVQTAIDKCNTLLEKAQKADETKSDYPTWEEIREAMDPLVNYDKITVGDMKVTELEALVREEGLSAAVDVLIPMLQGDGIVLIVPTGSGVVSEVADFAGNYTASVIVTLDMGDNPPQGLAAFNKKSLPATMKTKTECDPTKLQNTSKKLAAADLSTATGSTALTDFYGYALDLAFRTNAAESQLLLQTEPRNRVYEGEKENAALQGGGSYMEFTTQAGLSATKMVKLMDGIRVVFMNGEDNTVLALAKLDMQLGKGDYTVLSQEQQEKTGKYAYLSTLSKTESDYQISDLIDQTTYNALQKDSSVSFDKDAGRVKAKLYLYGFDMKVSSTSTATETKYTGGITIGNKLESNAITPLEMDTPKKVTAIVYLDGSVVTNATVAANAAQSMAGKLNLQFSSDADLMPADNTALKQGKAEGN